MEKNRDEEKTKAEKKQ